MNAVDAYMNILKKFQLPQDLYHRYVILDISRIEITPTKIIMLLFA